MIRLISLHGPAHEPSLRRPSHPDAPAVTPTSVRLATAHEIHDTTALGEVADRCGVPDAFRELIQGLRPAAHDSIDLIMANGLEDRPVLVAVGATSVWIVDPARAAPGVRSQLLEVPLLSIARARLVKDAVGGRRTRWFVLERESNVTVELSKRGAEAASQVVYVVNERIEAARNERLGAVRA